jgi:YggT family protein
MRVLLEVILMALELYKWVMLAMIIMSWLIAFNIVNTRNQIVDGIWRVLLALTEPVLKPIRRLLPRMQIDLSPIILFFGIYIVQQVIQRYIYPAMPF